VRSFVLNSGEETSKNGCGVMGENSFQHMKDRQTLPVLRNKA
jgi:hypothetical protein